MNSKKIIKKIIGGTGYSLVRSGRGNDFITWSKDGDFEVALERVKPYTLLERDRLFPIWQFARQARVLPGAMAQVGVFRGGSARLIAYAKEGNGTKFYLFDTFQGMPEVDPKIDLHKKGDFKDTSLESVKKIFSDTKDVIFCPGFFPQTSDPARNEKFSFVYIDVDIYQSVIDSLNFFYPRMLPGGFMIFDDYKGKNTPGVKKALDEFLVGKKEMPIITAVAQCLLVKFS